MRILSIMLILSSLASCSKRKNTYYADKEGNQITLEEFNLIERAYQANEESIEKAYQVDSIKKLEEIKEYFNFCSSTFISDKEQEMQDEIDNIRNNQVLIRSEKIEEIDKIKSKFHKKIIEHYSSSLKENKELSEVWELKDLIIEGDIINNLTFINKKTNDEGIIRIDDISCSDHAPNDEIILDETIIEDESLEDEILTDEIIDDELIEIEIID